MQVFYALFTETDTTCILDENESSHLINVLRKKVGDTIFITNGKGLLVNASIQIAHSKAAVIALNSILNKVLSQHPYYLHIAIAPTKNIDRIEYFVEKACEFGIDEITPIICDRSERKEIKTERLQKIALSAMKQSGSTFLPIINESISFKTFIKNKNNILVCTCEGNRIPIQQIEQKDPHYIFLIGPEGDFTEKEILLTKELINTQFIDLGNKTLRTETAGIYVSAYIYSKFT